MKPAALSNVGSEWEALYRAGAHHSVWPWSELVGLATRYVGNLTGRRVLELGCGVGANIPFFLGAGAEYAAIEGSETAVAEVHQKYRQLKDVVSVGDFTAEIPDLGPLDLVVDRAALTHNHENAITRGLALARAALRPGGWYIGVDWFSDRHPDRLFGDIAEDEFTFTNFRAGQFVGCGRVHFSSETHLRHLFTGFDLVLVTEKTVRRLEPVSGDTFAAFNVVARKPVL